MRPLDCGLAPLAAPSSASSRLVRTFAFGLIAVGLSACANGGPPPYYAGGHMPQTDVPARVATQPAATADVEDDGRPAQLPPARRPLPEEDDPTQPWSPNYGKRPGTYDRPSAPPARTASLTTEAANEATMRPRTSRALRADEADALVLRAIQNHETRRP